MSATLQFGQLRASPQLLQRSEDLGLLKETLEEEKNADEKLTQLSETINQDALQSSSKRDSDIGRQQAKRETSRSRKTRTAA